MNPDLQPQTPFPPSAKSHAPNAAQLPRQSACSAGDSPARDEIVLYRPDENVSLEVRVDGGNVWLNRLQLSELFGRDVKTIGKHINNALREELCGLPPVAKFATTAADGKIYQTEHYNLEVVTSRLPKGAA